MSGLFRPHYSFLQTNAWQRQAQNALRYNTSQVGAVVPMIYGTVRQQMNLLAFGGYRGPGGGKKGKGIGPLPIGGTSQTAKGGGGGKKGGKKAQPDFTLDVDVGICEGPVDIQGDAQVWASAETAHFQDLGLHLYRGENGQAADPTAFGMGATVGYSGTCHVTATPIDLGPSPVMPNLSFEVTGYLAGTLGNQDADPGQVVTHFLTDPQRGAMFPAEFVDNFADFSAFCQQAQMGISVSLDGQQTALEWLGGMLTTLSCAVVWSGELLKIVPYADGPVGNWSPDVTPKYDINEDSLLRNNKVDEFLIDERDPIELIRTSPAEAPNWFGMEYLDRLNHYNSTIMSVFDQTSIDSYGLRIGDNLQGRQFADENAANFAAQTILQRKQYVRNTVKFKLGFRYSLLEPMDVITITCAEGLTNQQTDNADRYLNKYLVRILSIEEDDNGELSIEAEEMPKGMVHPIYRTDYTANTPLNSWYGGDASYQWDIGRTKNGYIEDHTSTVPFGYEGWGGNHDYGKMNGVPQLREDWPDGCLSVWIKPTRQGMTCLGVPPGYTFETFPFGPLDLTNPNHNANKEYFFSTLFSCEYPGALYWNGQWMWDDHENSLFGWNEHWDGTNIYCFGTGQFPPIYLGFYGTGEILVAFADYNNPESGVGGYGWTPYPNYVSGQTYPHWETPWTPSGYSRLLSTSREQILWNQWQHLYMFWAAPRVGTKGGFGLYINGVRQSMDIIFQSGYAIESGGHPAGGGQETAWGFNWLPPGMAYYGTGNQVGMTNIGWHACAWGGFMWSNSLLYYANAYAGCVTDFWFSARNSLGQAGWQKFYNSFQRKGIFDLGEFGEKPYGGSGPHAQRPDIFLRNYNGTTGDQPSNHVAYRYYPPFGLYCMDEKVIWGHGVNQARKDWARPTGTISVPATSPLIYPQWPGGSGLLGGSGPISGCTTNPWQRGGLYL